jgi:GNAT superfamily N-acetyltransferase
MSTTATGQVRRARPADAAPLAVVHVRSWQGAYRGLLPQEYLDGLEPADRTDRWRRALERDNWPAAGCLVAVSDSEVAGFVNFGPTRDTDPSGSRVGEISAIYVLPEAWGTGLGRGLMTAALSQLGAGGYEAAALWVLESNVRARRFYARAGWTPDGSAKQEEIGGAPVTEVRYRRPLP